METTMDLMRHNRQLEARLREAEELLREWLDHRNPYTFNATSMFLAQTKSQVETGPTVDQLVDPGVAGSSPASGPVSLSPKEDIRYFRGGSRVSKAQPPGRESPAQSTQSLPGERPGTQAEQVSGSCAAPTAGTKPHSGANEVLSAEEISFVATAAYAPGGFMPELVNKPLKRLCGSHEALRAQLAEAIAERDAALKEAKYWLKQAKRAGDDNVELSRQRFQLETEITQLKAELAEARQTNADILIREELTKNSLTAKVAELRKMAERIAEELEIGIEWLSDTSLLEECAEEAKALVASRSQGDAQFIRIRNDLAAKVAEQAKRIEELTKGFDEAYEQATKNGERLDELREWARVAYIELEICADEFKYRSYGSALLGLLSGAPACLRDKDPHKGKGCKKCGFKGENIYVAMGEECSSRCRHC